MPCLTKSIFQTAFASVNNNLSKLQKVILSSYLSSKEKIIANICLEEATFYY